MKFVVQTCKKNGLRVWIEGDDGYPDGFAGGIISKDYPQLGMQGIIPDARCAVAGGQTVSFPLPTDTLGIIASPLAGEPPPAPEGAPLPVPADGKLKWTATASSVVTVQGGGVEMRYSVAGGQTLVIQVPPDTKSIQAAGRGARGARGGAGRGAPAGAAPAPLILPVPTDGQFKWTAPGTGTWELAFIRHLYRSSPTRMMNREDGTTTKDSLYSLIDYLDPDATRTYLKVVYETYEKLVGDEFGKTILGFRGDETDFTGFAPWTPHLFQAFQKEKGYDLQPFIAQIFANPLTPQARRVKADYWDVWSGLFRDNFYKIEQQWCHDRHMEYMVHLNHEETMMARGGGEDMIKNEGSFWRDMRYVGVPGIDNLNQIGPGIVADFPKLAASAAHLNGRPQVWAEEGGDTGPIGKFVADYQLVRGVNFMNIRGLNSAPPAGTLQDRAHALGWYVSRSQYLLATGRPAAQVALFHPTDSFWMGDQEADTVTVRLTTQLMEHQIDFDHIDPDALAAVCTLDNGGLKNLSGQIYRAIIIPTSTVIQKNVLQRLRAFAAAGGRVIFVGRTPSMVVDRTFLNAEPAPDLGFATLEAAPDITPRVLAALPRPDVLLDSPCPPLKYIRRALRDGDVYFFFNESSQPQSRTATLAGRGQVQVWDAADGTIYPLAGAGRADGSATVRLTLGPQEARFIVIGPLPPAADPPLPAAAAARSVADLGGDWSITLGESQLTTTLKSWSALGAESFAGTAKYTKTFDIPAAGLSGRVVWLDLGNVNETAVIRLNGIELEPRGWPPFLWDVTGALKPGSNTLEVQVQGPRAQANRGRAGAGRGAPTGPPADFAAPAPTGLLGPVRLITP